MKSITLPFTLDVELKTYHNRAFPLGALKASIENYDILLCNKFINCMYDSSNGKIEPQEDYGWFADDGVTYVQKMILDSEVFDNKGIDIICLNKEMLENGNYVFGLYDEFYIKGKNAFNRFAKMHDYLIIGFDDEREIFKSVGYLEGGKYDFFNIDYNDYRNSIIKCKQKSLFVQYNKINKEYVPEINIDAIVDGLTAYLCSKKNVYNIRSRSHYGMEAWDKFAEYVQNIGDNKLDNRYGLFFGEHRKLMYMRIKKLYELSFFYVSELVEEYYNDVYILAQSIHYLFLKYNITQDSETYKRLIKVIKAVNMREQEIIYKLLMTLKKSD